MIFCTLFNWAYLPQGIVLYKSLDEATQGNFTLYALCMDDFTAAAMKAANLRNLRILTLAEIEDDTLRGLRSTRTIGEYCWTLTSPLLLHVLSLQPAGTVVSYVDADLWFASDPRVVLDELGTGSIYIHEHDFAPAFQHLMASAGRFNVGLSSFRNNIEGRACLERWKEQCINECVMDPASGKCGDQHYLDEWPALYPDLVISANPGVGLAPWNVDKHKIARRGNKLEVDGRPVVFYHFHSLKMLRSRLGFKPILMAAGEYCFGPDLINSLYSPYARELWRASGQLEKSGHPVNVSVPTVLAGYATASNRQLLFQFAGQTLSVSHNVKLLSWLYGIDAARDSL